MAAHRHLTPTRDEVHHARPKGLLSTSSRPSRSNQRQDLGASLGRGGVPDWRTLPSR